MNIARASRFRHSIQGQMLRRSERREVAIFLRDRALWVADFVDGQGELVEATTWFRFNCGDVSNSHARRRMVHEAAVPLSAELVARIERLQRPASDRRRGTVARLIEAIAARWHRRPTTTRVVPRMDSMQNSDAESDSTQSAGLQHRTRRPS